jgi:hypothetical protein
MGELKHQRNPRWINTVGLGCYCPAPIGKELDDELELSEVKYVSG